MRSSLLQVAIKKVPSAFNDLTDALRILREIRLMRHFHVRQWRTRCGVGE
jgi:hypothetical protein